MTVIFISLFKKSFYYKIIFLNFILLLKLEKASYESWYYLIYFEEEKNNNSCQ